MTGGTEKVLQYYNEVQQMVAVLFGMFLQFFLGDRRGFKMIVTIAASAIFVSLFIMPAIIEILNIEPTSKVANALFALSAIMSVELLAIIITIAPKAIRAKMTAFLGVRNDSL